MDFLKRLKLFVVRHIVEGFLLKRKLKDFHLLFGGHIYFQLLSAAVQFDLFSLLHGRSLTQGQIGQALQIEDKPCRIMLLGLTATGLLKKRGETYSNSLIARIYLERQSPKNIINIVKWQHFINYQALYHLFDALKENRNVGLSEFPGEEPTLYERLSHDPPREQIFQDAMAQISRQAIGMLTEFVDLKDVKHLVDVGGGHGSNILKLTEKYPCLRASVFDLPTVCAEARDIFQTQDQRLRLGVFEGDCFKDDFPQGPDCYLFCHFFTIWSLEKNLQLLKKAYQALPPGGRVIIFNMMQNNAENGPLSAALGSPYFLTLATGEGMLYTWKEYQELFKLAGFENIRTFPLPVNHGAIVGFKGVGTKGSLERPKVQGRPATLPEEELVGGAHV